MASLQDAGPHQVARLIADTSGYTRWNEQAAAALSELGKTQEALQDIRADLKSLVCPANPLYARHHLVLYKEISKANHEHARDND